jgi:hypothetical protein
MIPVQDCDIFVTTSSPFSEGDPFIHQLFTFYFGGHSNIYSDGFFYESVGWLNSSSDFFEVVFHNLKEDNGYARVKKSTQPYFMQYGYNYNWQKESGYYYKGSFYIMRMKDSNIEKRKLTNDFLLDVVNVPQNANKGLYNYLFFLDTKDRYYCTDLVSRAMQVAHSKNGIERDFSQTLNYDGFITSCQDMLMAKDAYFTAYFTCHEEMINNQKEMVANIYYLEDIEGLV